MPVPGKLEKFDHQGLRLHACVDVLLMEGWVHPPQQWQHLEVGVKIHGEHLQRRASHASPFIDARLCALVQQPFHRRDLVLSVVTCYHMHHIHPEGCATGVQVDGDGVWTLAEKGLRVVQSAAEQRTRRPHTRRSAQNVKLAASALGNGAASLEHEGRGDER